MQAKALLQWLQGEGGRTGTIPASEMPSIHEAMCVELDWEAAAWIAVGRELRKLLGQEKEYQYISGRRAVVYRIPRSVPNVRVLRPALALAG